MSDLEPALYLSAAWHANAESLAKSAANQSGVLGLDVVVGYTVSNGAETIRYFQRLVGGLLVEQALGEAVADVSFTVTYPDAVAIAKGELDANAAMMQGRLKVAATNMAKVIAMLPLTTSAEYLEFQKQLSELTIWP